jgi:hypothetical protein
VLTKADLLKRLDELDAGFITVSIASGQVLFEGVAKKSDVRTGRERSLSNVHAQPVEGDLRTGRERSFSNLNDFVEGDVRTGRALASEENLRTALSASLARLVRTHRLTFLCAYFQENELADIRTALDNQSSKDVDTAKSPSRSASTTSRSASRSGSRVGLKTAKSMSSTSGLSVIRQKVPRANEGMDTARSVSVEKLARASVSKSSACI